MAKDVQQLDRVIIRFAGDSGDGMQLTGDRFTTETASFGNDLSTLPDFPAEIRAPAGTLPGVSAFQLHFADHDIMTPGDRPDVLVAMNPAALKANIGDLRPRRRHHRQHRRVHQAQPGQGRLRRQPARRRLAGAPTPSTRSGLTSMTVEALKGIDITKKDAERAKNMFALGLLSWLYNRPTEGTVAFLRTKFAADAGDPRGQHHGVPGRLVFGETTEDFAVSYEIKPATHARRAATATSPATSRCPTGWWPRRSAAGLPLFLGLLPDHPGLGHPARAVASTSGSACARSRPRTRSPRSARRSGRRTAGRWP